ncbi:para-aminobenzoate synthetase component 1 [Parafrankia irregularis]|uniref:Para-aminobenzoate synthetase component 1 n=1 Tax=Parafrankia irregularis TaxID=795642 RepID=A0A0S4QL68_9ACTN|nr:MULTISPECIES: chorismate-binding protein [Parafrankia]MBE3202020.1 chorismate-binding protein [Parafrankia sp. CH37]CUU55794.1 para-aminobenzoate synthetase component 1 [Parafrankia irregularis]
MRSRAAGVTVPGAVRGRESYLLAGGLLATGVMDVSDDLRVLDGGGFWGVVVDFEGGCRCVRFREVRQAPAAAVAAAAPWQGPAHDSWATSMDAAAYIAGVGAIRAEIAAGEVYQVNLCRLLSAPIAPGPAGSDLAALAAVLAAGNPAPYSVVLDAPEADLRIVGASPELFLSRDGDVVRSGPIKGTGRTAADLRDKDVAENVMIVDLVRNDLGRVARPGSVTVPALCRVEQHPGLVHLVSTVQATLAPQVGWAELLAATCPPGSVSGAPKSSALRIINRLEPVARGHYCGGIGWVDADTRRGWLSVAIRTFWLADERIWFGTGAGITWGSDAEAEWRETELKAANLLSLASATASTATSWRGRVGPTDVSRGSGYGTSGRVSATG